MTAAATDPRARVGRLALVWAALAVTMDLFGQVSRRTAGALGMSFAPAVEEHTRALVEQLRSTRPAPSG